MGADQSGKGSKVFKVLYRRNTPQSQRLSYSRISDTKIRKNINSDEIPSLMAVNWVIGVGSQ